MDKENIHHLSAVRVGGKLVYNGVNGDAFAFGDKPSVAAFHNASLTKSHSQQMLKMTHDTPPAPPDKPAISSKQVQLQPASSTSTLTLPPSSSTTTTQKSGAATLTPPSPSSKSGPPVVKELVLNPQYITLSSAAPPPSPVASLPPLPPPPPPPSPAALGLPPILPPPPAAHLPPPLPSRPPSAAPSRSSSLSSLLSFRLDDRSRQSSPPHSPDSMRSMDNDDNHHGYHYLPNFLFRSSGTIKVEAQSRDLPAPGPQAPSSPPPLPLPTTISLLPPSSSTETPHLQSTASKTTTTVSPSTAGHSSLTTSTESSVNGSEGEEEEGELVDNTDMPSAGECETLPYIHSSNKTGEIVTSKESKNWIFQKKSHKSVAEENSDVNRNIIPPEFGSLRKRSMTYADVITSALVFYKFNKGRKKKIRYVPPKLEKAPQCRKCGRPFGLLCFRHHCSRCKKSFCDSCIPIKLYDSGEQDSQTSSSSLTRICNLCSEEIAYENSRGRHRGLWTQFQEMRAEARANRGLDVTSCTPNKGLESLNMLDVTPGLRSLCLRFLVEVHQQLEKQPRHKFLASYLHFENPTQSRAKGKIKSKECHSCDRQLRMLTDIRDCSICEQTFCMMCTYKTLQLYLPVGTDLRGYVSIDMIKFHVKDNDQDEVEHFEASELYRVCAVCEDIVLRNLRVLEFDQKVPDLEAEMFDLQRQIDHALTYGPHMFGMQRSVSAANIDRLHDNEAMAGNIRLANRLYDRYMRAYDNLLHMEPQTNGQKALHKHIKQAMYDFYLKRRDQLKSTLRRRDSCTSMVAEIP